MKLQFDTNKLSITDLVALRKLEYRRLQPTKCPLLNNELVFFNKNGFFHLTHDGRRRIRNPADQRMRLNLLPQVCKVIKDATAFGSPIRVIPAQDNKFGKAITYYEIIYRTSPKRCIAVVIRRIGNGQLHYYSIRYYKRHDQ